MDLTTAIRTGIIALALLSPIGLPGSALGTHVSCGDVITEDTTLDSDVICRDGPGGGDAIVIGADNITLDLNGHNARGSCWEEFGSGVLNVGHRGVTIENGVFGSNQTTGGAGFHGVRLVDADDNTLRNLGATTCVEGPGFSLLRSNGNHILDVGATTYRGSGISLQQSNENLIRGSTFAGNSTGIALNQSDGNLITQNSLGNIVGVSLFESHQNRLAENSVDGVGDHRCRCALGIQIARSNANLLRENTIFGSLSAEGLLVGDSDDNRIIHNYFTDNGAPYEADEVPARDGLLIDGTSDRTELKHNTVLRSGDDGIAVENTSTTLVANRANENGDLGIEAVPGVQAHGNHAYGNGNPLQCLNVKCN